MNDFHSSFFPPPFPSLLSQLFHFQRLYFCNNNDDQLDVSTILISSFLLFFPTYFFCICLLLCVMFFPFLVYNPSVQNLSTYKKMLFSLICSRKMNTRFVWKFSPFFYSFCYIKYSPKDWYTRYIRERKTKSNIIFSHMHTSHSLLLVGWW